jgi:hypothetical protein
MDEAYRLAHLPLIAPDHPRVIGTRAGTSYRMGRHDPVTSLVLPVPAAALSRSQDYRALESELRASSFAGKIDWPLLERRQERLHATVCGSMAAGEAPPAIDEMQRRRLKELGPVRVELRGLFSGTINVGRLYLRLYPERRGGMNVLRAMQRALGRQETDLYIVGMYNFVDDLDAGEAAALDALIRRWWDRPLLQFRADRLWLLRSCDDLVLDGVVVETIAL